LMNSIISHCTTSLAVTDSQTINRRADRQP